MNAHRNVGQASEAEVVNCTKMSAVPRIAWTQQSFTHLQLLHLFNGLFPRQPK